MAEDNEELPMDEEAPPAEDNLDPLETGSPAERSGHVAVTDGQCMFVWGGYKNAQVRGFYDFYLPRDEIWIYNMETGRWTKHRTSGDVPPSMSGSCAVCMDRVLYLFGGHHAHGNTNKVSDLVDTGSGVLVFFGGYGYYPEGEQIGTFEFDETSFWNSGLPRGWNDHVHVLDTETYTWSQPVTTGKSPSPRAAHACATVGNRGYVFGGRYRESRMNDLYYLNLEKWEWHEIITQGACPLGRSWHSLTPVSSDHLFLFGGFTTDKQPLSDAWIYCISKNEWIQFEHNYSEKPRFAALLERTEASSVFVNTGSQALFIFMVSSFLLKLSMCLWISMASLYSLTKWVSEWFRIFMFSNSILCQACFIMCSAMDDCSGQSSLQCLSCSLTRVYSKHQCFIELQSYGGKVLMSNIQLLFYYFY
uniref:Kelch domain containing 2 n=1 Tax=Anolis carolinensis TaxID=28377 RepID=A0A803TMV0_ANOCA